MSKKRMVVFGSSGMLGWVIVKYFLEQEWEVISVGREEFDIGKDEYSNLDEVINPGDYVVNCTGIIKPRIKTTPTDEILQVNAIHPRNLALYCRTVGAKLFHITTDCVFSGKRGGYDETDLVDVDDLYGLSKAAGDVSSCMTLRTSIIGEEKRNNYSLIEWVKSNKNSVINGYTNHIWNGVTTLELAKIIESIAQKNLYRDGVFHVFSPESVSKLELLKKINAAFKLNIEIKPTEAESTVDRTLSSTFSLSKEVSKKNLDEQLSELVEFNQ